jgi:hypothetical protein
MALLPAPISRQPAVAGLENPRTHCEQRQRHVRALKLRGAVRVYYNNLNYWRPAWSASTAGGLIQKILPGRIDLPNPPKGDRHLARDDP